VNALFFLLPTLLAPIQDESLNAALELAGENRAEIAEALEKVPDEQRKGMRWLIERMPERDLVSLDAEYLLENCEHAYAAWTSSPWRGAVSEDVFLDAVLPYASVNERRDRWRADFRERFSELVADAKSPAEAAAILNNEVFKLVNVKYSTKRPKADQSPYESIEAGLASCTGLTVLLIDACRAVGVPARFVGTPLWSDGSGNHSWVEVWDEDGWHYTGAAEPTGDKLDEGWFAGRAATCTPDDPKHGVFATTWRKTPIHFPMVWARGDQSVNAVQVTKRYTEGAPVLPEGWARVRIHVIDGETGERCTTLVQAYELQCGVYNSGGRSNDESFDANDHLTLKFQIGEKLSIFAHHEDGRQVGMGVTVAEDGQLLQLTLPAIDSPLSKHDSALTALQMGHMHRDRTSRERKAEFDSRKLTIDGMEMPFWYKAYGDKPNNGRSLYISMHGGGGAPKAVNDKQWENQKGLYKPKEGIYLAPRAATDTWNLWHQAHIDDFFDRLIADLVVFENVDPNKVYFMGYSAGGDGVYQLAPRMADRLAAAAMMAGHPNETKPDGLRNLPFTLHMGGEDNAYDRNKIAREWKVKLAELHEADPKGYEHLVEVHEGKGHWMDREDAVAVPWMAQHTRNLRPERIVWLQDDVTHDRFYWLSVDEPKARSRVVVEREGQTIRVVEAQDVTQLTFRLDDVMFDLDQEIVVVMGENELFRGIVPRTVATLAKTLEERGDPTGMFPAEVTCSLEFSSFLPFTATKQ